MKNKIVIVLSALLLSATLSSAEIINLPVSGGSVLSGNIKGDYTGEIILSMGDMTGDFVPEVAISARNYTPSSRTGRVYIVKLSPEGLPATVDLASAANVVKITGALYGSLGTNMAVVPDRNADRLNEFMVSQSGTSEVFVINSNKNFPSAFSVSAIGGSIPGLRIAGIYVYSMKAVDLDKKGKADYIFGGIDGKVTVILGEGLPASGVVTVDNNLINGVTGFAFQVGNSDSRISVDVADFDRNGYPDIITVDSFDRVGKLIRNYGTPFAAFTNVDDAYLDGTRGTKFITGFANSVGSVGDITDDLFPDIVFRGSPLYSSSSRALFYWGQADWPAVINLTQDITGKGTIINGLSNLLVVGPSIAQVGDTNDDGIRDILVGDPSYSKSAGRAIKINGRKNADWPSVYTITAADTQYIGNGFAGSNVGFVENLFGGVGCGTDNGLTISAPGYGLNIGKVYIFKN